MVTYLDTSAMIKLYVDEAGREAVIAAVSSSDRIVTSAVAYAEARAGLARRLREGGFSDQEHRGVVTDLDREWGTYTRLPVHDAIARVAGRLAERHALRGFDAIHLASAMHLAERFEGLRFLAFDHRLVNAARDAGVAVYAD